MGVTIKYLCAFGNHGGSRLIPGRVLDHIYSNQGRYIEELKAFLKIPSISSPEHAGDVRKAAEWILDRTKRLGFSGRIFETSENPVVFAEIGQHDDAPTLMFYSHYDVQPPGDLENWKTPPFYPDVRDGAIYARGAADDKGQLFCTLATIGSVMAIEGKLPLNVKLLFEGGEEMGSPGLEKFIREHIEQLKADAVLITDAPKYTRDIPAIYYGLRGGVAFQIEVRGPSTDIHSGMFGGAVVNPINALTRILGDIKDHRGKIRIPGFYDHVRDLEEWERKEMASIPFDGETMKKYLGINEFATEDGYTPMESMTARPAFDVNGIAGGYYEKGMLWSIPDKAGAYLSFLLVPDQDPEDVARHFEEYVHSRAPEEAVVKLSKVVSFDPVIVPRSSKVIRVAEKAIEYGFGRKPAMIRSGGGIGVAALIRKMLSTENIVITGWNDPEDNEHAPNEHFSLENFRKGMITTAAFMYGLADSKKRETTISVANDTT